MGPFRPWKCAQIQLCVWLGHILRDRLTSDQPTPTGHNNSNQFIISVELIFRPIYNFVSTGFEPFFVASVHALLLAQSLCFLEISTMLRSISQITPNQ